MSVLLIIIYIFIIVILALAAFAVFQIKMAGLTVKDFWTFIEANQTLDKLDLIARKYDQMSTIDQIIFLKEAEKMFRAFDKVPSIIWEDEYPKYSTVLEKYKDIKIMRWQENSQYNKQHNKV